MCNNVLMNMPNFDFSKIVTSLLAEIKNILEFFYFVT